MTHVTLVTEPLKLEVFILRIQQKKHLVHFVITSQYLDEFNFLNSFNFKKLT